MRPRADSRVFLHNRGNNYARINFAFRFSPFKKARIVTRLDHGCGAAQHIWTISEHAFEIMAQNGSTFNEGTGLDCCGSWAASDQGNLPEKCSRFERRQNLFTLHPAYMHCPIDPLHPCQLLRARANNSHGCTVRYRTGAVGIELIWLPRC